LVFVVTKLELFSTDLCKGDCSEMIVLWLFPWQATGIELLNLIDIVDLKKLCGTSYPSHIATLEFEKVLTYSFAVVCSFSLLPFFSNESLYPHCLRIEPFYRLVSLHLV